MNQLPTLNHTFSTRSPATASTQANRFNNPVQSKSSTLVESISSANLEAVIENKMAEASIRLSQVSLAYRFGAASAVRTSHSRLTSYQSAFLGHQMR